MSARAERIIECTPTSKVALIFGGTRLRIRGAGPMDEVFTLSLSGSFNITAIEEAIDARALPRIPVDVPIDAQLRRHLKLRDYDRHYLDMLSDDRLARPGIMLNLKPDDRGVRVSELIDGVHRAMRLARDGVKKWKVLIVPEELVDPFRVTMAVEINGTWRELTGQEQLDPIWGTYTQRVSPP